MTVYRIDPLEDSRWVEFLCKRDDASIFHSPQWLQALRLTYRYMSFVLTTAAPGEELNNGLVFCDVRSWLTGRRMVSLPFSDHCEPLVKHKDELDTLLSELTCTRQARKWKYLELRPRSLELPMSQEMGRGEQFFFHQVDLRPELNALFRSFHKTSIQQMIRRAEKERLEYEEGASERLLAKFYRQLILTRRRQNVPPQPLAWFRNLIASMGNRLKIRVASKDGRPVASMLTLHFGNTMVYKYGCSDRNFSNLGGTQLLLWRSIQDAKAMGLMKLDMGRSDPENEGLVQFKDRWGAQRSVLTYWRYAKQTARKTSPSKRFSLARKICQNIPDALLTTAGNLLYRHIG